MKNLAEIESKIESVLEKVRPYLELDQGAVEYVRFHPETGVCEVRLLGNCAGCPLSLMTLRAGIERYLLSEVAEISRVEAVR
ncbi:MAG: NifU family protein [Candidatus Kapaibacterium sp.]